jgi:glutamyl-tRNA synthetase
VTLQPRDRPTQQRVPQRVTQRVTRLAPSPTGSLHLGNARTFLLNWLMARRDGWTIVLRIEDIDGPRIKPLADKAALDDLTWLGLDWDVGPIYQSHRMPVYQSAVASLVGRGLAYPCVCTRTEIERAASAPHADDGATVYPGTCRGRFASIEAAQEAVGRAPAVRFRVDDTETIRWDDQLAGPQEIAIGRLGDFVIAKADGTPAYQLAVVVDDAEAGVTDVVRGDDLLDSTPRQIVLARALGLPHTPRYHHVPLVVGPDGRRLAKRHGDTRLATYREAGVSAGRLLAWIARHTGVDVPTDIDEDTLTARDLVDGLDVSRLAREPIRFTPADDAQLRRSRSET